MKIACVLRLVFEHNGNAEPTGDEWRDEECVSIRAHMLLIRGHNKEQQELTSTNRDKKKKKRRLDPDTKKDCF